MADNPEGTDMTQQRHYHVRLPKDFSPQVPDVYRAKAEHLIEKGLQLMRENWLTRVDVAFEVVRAVHVRAQFGYTTPSGQSRVYVHRKQVYEHGAGGRINHPYDTARILGNIYHRRMLPILKAPFPLPPMEGIGTAASYAAALLDGLRRFDRTMDADVLVSDGLQCLWVVSGDVAARRRKRKSRRAVTYDNRDRNTSRQVALWVLREAMTACNGFGRVNLRGVPSLYTRASLPSHILGFWKSGRVWQEAPGGGGWQYDGVRAARLLKALDVPPDPFEAFADGGVARKLVRRLQAEGKPTVWRPDFVAFWEGVAAEQAAMKEAAKAAAERRQEALKEQAVQEVRQFGRRQREIHFD